MCIHSPMNKFESFPIVKSVSENLKRVSESPSLSLICGVSGGIDSMVLLYILHRLQVNCTVTHCNYQLRGEESEKDMKLVEEMSAMWGFECITARFNPSDSKESNTQIWARNLRYTMFRDLRQEVSADFIVTAHHQEDQVETILQKILRGAGPAAWSGMSIRDGDLIRPLLNVSKKEIRDFAQTQHVPYRDDQSNQESGYARNLIRNELTPELNRLVPGWKQNVLNIPERANQFQALTDTLLSQIKARSAAIKRSAFLELPEETWPVLIHRFIETESESSRVSSGELKQVENIASMQTGGFLTFGKSLKLVRDRDLLILTDSDSLKLKSQTLSKNDLPFKSETYGITIVVKPWDGSIKKDRLQFDNDKIRWPITIRPWKDGDRIQPLGMTGSKLVADVLTDAKISSIQKKEAFLIESFDGIICAVIFPHEIPKKQLGVISDIAKCTTGTKKILLIDTDI